MKDVNIDNICFVIMGFGKKENYATNKKIDLDVTYEKIIRPAVLLTGMTCIRADQILISGTIDQKMYALLLHAKLVIADISTLNPNAIYELGIRHGIKDKSTIIIQDHEPSMSIPFDISHQLILEYNHSGDHIEDEEASKFKKELVDMIRTTDEKKARKDSPLYNFINNLEMPKVSPDEDFLSEVKEIVSFMNDKNTLYSLKKEAKAYMGKDDWRNAMQKWKEASEKDPFEPSYQQQYALCLYKSNRNDISTLNKALKIIQSLETKGEPDTETLGIGGAITKYLHSCREDKGDSHFLELSNHYYKRGYMKNNDYYNGENHALCLDELANFESDLEFKQSRHIEAKRVRIDIKAQLEQGDQSDYHWEYATLANCCYALNEEEEYIKYKTLFEQKSPEHWQLETFNDGIARLIQLLK